MNVVVRMIQLVFFHNVSFSLIWHLHGFSNIAACNEYECCRIDNVTNKMATPGKKVSLDL